MKYPICVAIVCASLGLAVHAAPKIEVDCGTITGELNPLNFGQNIEAADTRGIFGPAVGSPKWNRHDVKYGQGLWNPETGSLAAGSGDILKKLKVGSLRYPGGCLVHNFNWKQAVGPLEDRPDWKFGIDQYLELCQQLNLEPVITLTDYALPAEELPRHLAELVEYLNAPATPEHPWAQKRAQWGHPEPYRVRYFELGNESAHGNHNGVPRRRFNAEEYARYAVASAKAIRRIDPTVKLGIVTRPGNGLNYNCDWNREILKGAGDIADFVVVHFYGPGISNFGPEASLRAVLAYPDQLTERVKGYQNTIKECTGRELPLAVTEFNVGSSKSKPFAHRFSYLAGLMNSDLLQLWQKPDSQVIMAQYWHLLNGAWGMFNTPQDSGEITERHATMPFFELWSRFDGKNLVASRVSDNPTVAAPSSGGLYESTGDKSRPAEFLNTVDSFRFDFKNYANRPDISIKRTGKNELDITIVEAKKAAYLPFAVLKRPVEVPRGRSYDSVVSFEARVNGARGSAALGLGIADIRGWANTNSAGMSEPGLSLDGEFQRLEFFLTSLPDCSEKELLLRLEQIESPFSGTLEIRNLQVSQFRSATVPAYPALTTFAGYSVDRKKLYLTVLNKHPEQAFEIPVMIHGAKLNSGKSFELFQEQPETTEYFEVKEQSVQLNDSSFRWTFPKHSMTLFEFDISFE